MRISVIIGHPEQSQFHKSRNCSSKAEQVSAAEDKKYKQGDELPSELASREKRLAKIREAKAALESQAQARKEKCSFVEC
ncbi:hypothetical protein SAMN02745219_03486 [Desulfofundulus thermosubterraneus DSM 16057]|uniref:Transposase n=1 Tax=Desulfofundulus thermosubterraneus DSM 16057 TaxID=1121432 RepID=A0A1M6MN99_9FIRM|nr:hypothetical protein [Desulfofundulus thermosubterraneus]SHJ84961.1 hypothetical protein SAMN02745219_03486 [Desulfofundulus thermosubterraneus DSM 16057]